VLLTTALAELPQHGFEPRGQLDIANRAQRVHQDVELGGRDDQVDSIQLNVKLRLGIWFGRVFAWHDVVTIAPRDVSQVEPR
jgi:hypothetical protein